VLVDTHCHLDFNSFDPDRAQVIQRARESGINRLLNPGIDLSTSLAAVRLAETFKKIFASVGVHPNESLSWDENSLFRLKELATRSKVVAIGEIGLDYYRDRAPKDLQKQVFLEQLSLAQELELPVVIHNREATDDVLQILADWHHQLLKDHPLFAARPGVLHSFSGDVAAARKAMEINFYLGITGPVTYKSAQELHQVIMDSPLDRLLIETDAPFLSPHPKRGERNEPVNIRLITAKIGELRDLPYEAIASITTDNAQRLFQW
jgi:TatD DNase family protein